MVISRSVDVGQTVAASLQAPMLFTIAEDLRQDAGRHQRRRGRRRQAAAGHGRRRSRSTRSRGERFRGKVRQIRNAPQTVQNVVTYDAVIDVDNAELKLRPGMTANVTFVYAEKDDVAARPERGAALPAARRVLAERRMPSAVGGAPRRRAPPRARDAAAPVAAAASGARRGGEAAARARPTRGRSGCCAAASPQPVPIQTGLSDGTLTEVVEAS